MSPILCRAFTADDCTQVRTLFKRFRHDPGMRAFHPHPWTTAEALRVTNTPGRDYYAGVWVGDTLLGYGLLRGWEEGYDVPTLGIGIDLAAQGRGLGRCLMAHLHQVAETREAPVILLHVDRDNARAIRLYQSLGYELSQPRDRLDLRGSKRMRVRRVS